MPVKGRRSYTSQVRAAAADETRRRIVAAARAVLAAGDAFSMEAVAARAGVTRLTVYNRFESRPGVLEAMFDDMALQGGLFDLPAIFAEPDVGKALRSFVSVFCRFWTTQRPVLLKLGGLARLDAEIGDSLRQRAERRRKGLNALIGRLLKGEPDKATVDILFALTSFEMFEHLSVRNRGPRAVETLLQDLVQATVQRSARSA